MSSTTDRERILGLIQRLDAAYSKGLMRPEEYSMLRHGLELRLPPPKRPLKKRKYFRLKIAMIAIIAIMVLIALPLTLQMSRRPDFTVSDVKFSQGQLSMVIKNTGTAEAHDVRVLVRHSKGEVNIRDIDVLKPQDTINVVKGLQLELKGNPTQVNIVVMCKEGVTLNYPFEVKP